MSKEDRIPYRVKFIALDPIKTREKNEITHITSITTSSITIAQLKGVKKTPYKVPYIPFKYPHYITGSQTQPQPQASHKTHSIPPSITLYNLTPHL